MEREATREKPRRAVWAKRVGLSLGVVAALATGQLLLASPASAAPDTNVNNVGGTLYVTATTGKANGVILTEALGATTVRDIGDVVKPAPGSGCVQLDPHAVRCPGVNLAVIDTFDQADLVNAQVSYTVNVNAGDGPDLVLTGSGNDTLDGGPGSDMLFCGGGNDAADGGPDVDNAFGCETVVNVP
jgi:Ca2+-binding RTX toxin-like protein